MKRFFSWMMVGAAAALVCSATANAAGWPSASEMECSANHYHDDRLVSFAIMREQRVANASNNDIDPGQNGSVRVHAWNNPDVLVKACVQTAAESEAEAQSLASQISIVQGPGQIKPQGPSSWKKHWNVSYDVWAPAASNWNMNAMNGSINVDGVHGRIHYHTLNGSVHLIDVAGNVEGSTVNGSVTIDLEANQSNGGAVRAETTNGSVRLNIPENFSAQVKASTVNGRVHVDFPVTISGDIGNNMSFQVGNGGPLIEAKTVNGSVHISHKAS